MGNNLRGGNLPSASQNDEVCEPVDIADIKIDLSLPREERILSYLQQIKNPYKFQYKGLVVELDFADNGVSVEDRLAEYIRWRQRHLYLCQEKTNTRR